MTARLRFALLVAALPLSAQQVSFGCDGPQLYERLAPGQGGIKAFVDLYLRPNGYRIADIDGLMFGDISQPAQGSGRFGPVFGKCDPTTDNSIFRIQQLFPAGNQNVSGSATASAAAGGASPAARLAGSGSAASDVIVGFVDRGDFTPFQAFRWTAAGGLAYLGTLDPLNNTTRTSFATSTDTSGTVVVGFSQINGAGIEHAFRWTSAGMVDLGSPGGPTRDSRALDVDATGTIIVGDATFPDSTAFSGFRRGAFRWTAAQGFQSLGALAPAFPSIATAVSADGAVIVGQGGLASQGVNVSRAFRWTAAGGMVALPLLPGHTGAIATGVSDNGKIVVGLSGIGNPSYNPVLGYGGGTAFRWTATGGTQDLKQLLVTAGADLTDITLLTATGISQDGQWIVGSARFAGTPLGETRPYLVKFCDADIGGPCLPLRPGTPAPVAAFELSTTSPTTQSVTAGASATAVVTVTPSGGFAQPVTFSCTGLPASSTCQFAPASLTPSTAAISTTLTISTTAPSRGAAVGSLGDVDGARSTLFLLGLVGMWAAWRGAPSRRRLSRATFAAAAAIGAACSGGDASEPSPPEPPLTGGTPAGTYPIVIAATSGSGTSAISRTLTLTVTVTR